MAEAKIREIFNKFDADGSGQITAKELVDFLTQAEAVKNPDDSEEARNERAKQKAAHILVGADKNDDDKITFEELYAKLKNYV